MHDMPKLTGLAASRWASPPPEPSRRASTSSHRTNGRSNNGRNGHPPSPEQELARFSKIAARLKWKIPLLETGYAIAVNRLGKPHQEVETNEIHFKLDFHEYYMLIERSLVHLMGVFGIVIYAQAGVDGKGHGFGGRQDEFRGRSHTHRYHENVLLALDDPKNPLHESLGHQDVRKQLWRAKDLRNRWKDADNDGPTRFMPAPLENYNLKEILQTILLALEWAYAIAKDYVEQQQKSEARQQGQASESPTSKLEDWEFIVDAMDWEAV